MTEKLIFALKDVDNEIREKIEEKENTNINHSDLGQVLGLDPMFV